MSAAPADASATTASSVSPAAGTAAPGARLAWLDALRGIGAVAVVAEHSLPWMMPVAYPRFLPLHLGLYGVMVFFLVSGYIIPASLERHGDVRRFWIGRFFRLYPLYLVVITVVLAVSWWMPIREGVRREWSTVPAHVTMLLDTVQHGGLVDTMWTLSYEMVFYLLVTLLFLVGAHRRSGHLAILFGVASLVVGLVVTGAVTDGGWASYVSCVIFVVGMACLITGRFRMAAACALGVMGAALTLFTSFVPWLGGTILAVMFTGTAIHRWQHGRGPLWPVLAAGALVGAVPLFAHQTGWRWVQPDMWLFTLALAGLTFAAGMLLRERRIPAVLTWLGLVSYSLYLVHHPILRAVTYITGDLRSWPVHHQAIIVGVAVALILVTSWLTYRYIERPMQAVGRRLAARAGPRPAVSVS